MEHMMRMVVALLLVLQCLAFAAAQGTLPNCTFPALYAFGDSLADVGNGIAAFPEKFEHCELDPYGVEFPMHPADRWTDGKMITDFLAWGVRLRPIYAVLRGTNADFSHGTCFACSGSNARNVTEWSDASGFTSPFGLNVQMKWRSRYQERVWFYENYNGGVVQKLPFLNQTGDSLYLIYAGFQDYFDSLWDPKLTPAETLEIVPAVVQAISDLIVKLVTVQYFYPPPLGLRVDLPIAKNILVANLPPLGCVPAMLTMYQSANASYDTHGCLRDINRITSAHNELLGSTVEALRAKYPAIKIYYADMHGVYTDILKDPRSYNVTSPLKACCGVGGSYNFNKEVQCGYTGMVGNELVNLTTAPCANRAAHLSWDGIHTSNTFNKAAATAILTGKHITPAGGLNCTPDFAFWDSRT